MTSPELNYIQVKFGQFIQMIHMIRIRRRIILITLHFLATVKGHFLKKLSVAESSHLFTNVMTDRQTHTHTDKFLVKTIMLFGIKRKSFSLSYRILHWSLLPTSAPTIHSPITFLPPPFSFPSVSYVLSEFGGNFFTANVGLRRAFHVKVVTNVTTRRYM